MIFIAVNNRSRPEATPVEGDNFGWKNDDSLLSLRIRYSDSSLNRTDAFSESSGGFLETEKLDRKVMFY